MNDALFGSELWKPALDKYAEVTGLTVELFGDEGQAIAATVHITPLVALFRQHAYDPGLFAECARRCLTQTHERPAVVVTESHGLTVVGTSLALDGVIVGAAVAGYALGGFSQVTAVQRWSQLARVPFDRLWSVVRTLSPLPERRITHYGELLQVLGDALLRENHRTRLYEDAVVKLEAAATAKDEFLAVLSHELRSPLSAISGWASVLKSNAGTEDVKQAAAAIARNVVLEARMIDDLLDVDRISRGTIVLDRGIHELSALIGGAVESSGQEIEKKALRVRVTYPAQPLLIEGDAGRLQQVFANIVSNAAKFTPIGGSVRVTLSREGSNARVVVSDTGKGIAPDFLPFMFDMFRQAERGTRREHGGLGIGLGVVKRLVELHGGTVTAASEGPGAGAEITVRLPILVHPPAVSTSARSAEPPVSGVAGLSILVVEDSEDARESLRILLELLGAAVAVARDGREALDMLKDASPDLVLCDLRMPRMDGFEFIHEFLGGSPAAHPPVVAMSGLTSPADRRRTHEAGFEGHIGKPFDAAGVVAAVAAAFRQREHH